MKRYGNIRFTRRMVVTLCLLVVAVNILMPKQIVKADSISGSSNWTFRFKYFPHGQSHPEEAEWDDHKSTLKYTSNTPVYSYILEDKNKAPGYDESENWHYLYCGFVTLNQLVSYSTTPQVSVSNFSKSGVNFYETYHGSSYINSQFAGSTSDIFVLCDGMEDGYSKIANYVKTGQKSDGMIIGGSDTNPTAVTNESIGYLQDVKLNLSYITPIKGDSIFETTNYQIYSDMIYNLKWNSKKTSSNYDLSSSYVQVYAKAEYSKSEYDKVSATDFIELGDYEKASKGKLKFSFLELFEKSNNCKSAYLSAFPLSSADYKNGKLQACSVTSNIKYKFYIRVYKGTDKGPWLCVSEKGSHHSNEFVNSGVKVPFNVSSGGLDSDGTYKPDGNINENGNGITGTGTDRDDADADTNANDKIQSKHDSSNTTFDKLEEFVQGIGDVPKMIADIFSFLPSWCLEVVAIGFALLMILVVVKFIRG